MIRWVVFTVPMEKSEADVFVAIIRKAVAQSVKMLDKVDSAAARTDSAPPAPTPSGDENKKKPAAKNPPPPPAKITP